MNMDMGSTMSSMAAATSAMSSMAAATASMSMDMASMSSAMASMSASMSMAMASAATTSAAGGSHGSMGGMDMGPSSSCKISMLWNWYTIDSCFISKSWHVTTRGMFAGTCLGVFAWILAIEALRRAHREFDRYVAKTSFADSALVEESGANSIEKGEAGSRTFSITRRAIPPRLWHQMIRATLYCCDFGASYLLMLMAMYYNGYVLITMFISAWISYFLLGGDTIAAAQQPRACC